MICIPCQKERLVKIVKYVDNNVVVGGGVDIGSGKLAIDENALLRDSQRRDGAVGDVPCKENVRIFTADRTNCPSREAKQKHKHQPLHLSPGSTPYFNHSSIIYGPILINWKKILGLLLPHVPSLIASQNLLFYTCCSSFLNP